MDRPTHLGLRHLALNARQFEAMKDFYVDLLGFAVEWEPDADNVYLSSGTDNLALHRARPLAAGYSAVRSAEKSALDHFGLIVRTADEVDRWASFLTARGIRLDTQPRTHRDGARSCYLRDPDGNQIQIIHHRPISDK